jgi:ABC-type nitrate/sulfonate/bicarbonate transport system substrate-binding protein
MTGLKIGGVPEHFNLPWRLAIEERLFEEIGLELHWSDMTGGTGQMIKGLQTGSIDIAVLLTEGITKSILDGLPAKIVNIYVNTPLRWGVHVPVHSSYNSISDLENGTFAISRYGSGSHLMAMVHAKQAGWDVSKLKFNVVGDVYGGLWALENKEADGFLWEKFTTHPFVEQGKCRFVDLKEHKIREIKSSLRGRCIAADIKRMPDYCHHVILCRAIAARNRISYRICKVFRHSGGR